MSGLLSGFMRDESGATAIEYALIATLVSVVMIAALKIIGTRLSAKFNAVSTQLSYYAPSVVDFTDKTGFC